MTRLTILRCTADRIPHGCGGGGALELLCMVCLCDDVGGESPQIAIVMGNFEMPCRIAQRESGVRIQVKCVFFQDDFMRDFSTRRRRPRWLVAAPLSQQQLRGAELVTARAQSPNNRPQTRRGFCWS
jgi:hypothetical protein